MSVQFGLWNFDHAIVGPRQVEDIKATLAPYASEGVTEYSGGEIHLLHFPFHVTPESEQETQPFLTRSGQVLLWDGRLDNRQELIGLLGPELQGAFSDAGIASAALERWGQEGLAKLVGDWALSLWNPRERSILLAKDFLGARSLYCSIQKQSFTWCTLIDPLIFPEKRSFCLEEEYLAGWLSQFPGTHLTPFAGIRSVPPSSYLVFRPTASTVRQYWNFDPGKKISYRNDCEYEEHFRTVFGESVRRRLRSASPVLAELSGGMDSSSIVCMADALRGRGFTEAARLDTISYYDDSEPNWKESPFFESVEQQRGRAGHHVALDFRNHWHPVFDQTIFAATPGSGINLSENAEYAAHIRSGRYRVLLQGIGGDEVLGGVPTPLPEIADLLRAGHMRTFLSQLIAWALASRRPALYLLADTIRQFLPHVFARNSSPPPAWLRPQFVKRNAKALNAFGHRFRIFGVSTSFQANLAALDALRRQVASMGVSPLIGLERRYPYLDRDLLEFLYAIPREQIVRPNQRRSLMRRALVGIVPAEILNRRRKAFIARAPLVSVQSELQQLLDQTQNMFAGQAGIVDAAAFRQCLKQAAQGGELPIVHVLRTLLIEAWLKHLSTWTKPSGHPYVQSQVVLCQRHCAGSQGFFS